MKKSDVDLDDNNNLVLYDPFFDGKSMPLITISDWNNGFKNDHPSTSLYKASALLDKRANQLFQMQNNRLTSWFSSIPASVLQLARKSHRPFGVLMFVATDEYALQLFNHSTVLFCLLLEAAFEHSWSLQKFRQALRTKRAIMIQEVLGQHLDQPGAVLKFINKVDFISLKLGDLKSLIATIKSDDYLRFERHKVVPFNLIALSKTYAVVIGMDWLFQATKDERNKSIALIARLHTLYRDYPIREPSINDLNKIASYNALRSYYDVLKSMVDKIHNFRKQYPFPKPPIKGNRFFHPVSDAFALYDLGEEQHNCVFEYLDEIMSGRYYVYRVELNGVATLGLNISPENLVIVDDLLGYSNRKVDVAIHDFVNNWIKNSAYAARHVWQRKWVAEFKSVQYNRINLDYEEFLSKPIHSYNHRLFIADYKAHQNDQLMSDYSRYCNSP